MRVVSRWCRCVVQRLCATDCKHPCLVRAAAPHSAPARMPGVYAQGLCTMQSQPSIHSPSPRGRGLGIGIENKHFFEKTDFFYKLTAVMKREVHHSRCFMFLSAKLNLGKLNVDSLCSVSACCACSVNRKLNSVAYVKLRNDILYICYGGDRCAVYL